MAEKKKAGPERAAGGKFKACKMRPNEAFELYYSLGDKRSYAALARAMEEKGAPITVPTLSKWAQKHRWQEQIKERDVAERLKGAKELLELKDLGEKIGAEHFDAVLAVVLQHLTAIVPAVTVPTPDDLEKMVDVADRLQSIAHNMRGEIVPTSAEQKTADLGEFEFKPQLVKSE